MPEVIVRRWDKSVDGALTENSLRKMIEAKGYSVSRYTYGPGTYFGDHSHSVAKIDAVLSGTFRMGMYGQFVDLGAGDWIEVPAGATHSAEVIGVEAVVSLDAVRN
ncbi:MAG: cupin domain-containing protein [SAR86 cluster bacterium]|nr:cupin domain-containing protein [SAR86 cluster bacterium]